MMRRFFAVMGYHTHDDAIEFVMTGLAVCPSLLFLSGNVVAGAISLVVLIVLLALIGMQAPPPAPPSDEETSKNHKPSD